MKNYRELLTVQPIDNSPYTRVTKVTMKPYGFRIQMFNSYITEFFVKLIINKNKSAKAHYLVRKNYHADNRYTLYFGVDGNEVTKKEYREINKKA